MIKVYLTSGRFSPATLGLNSVAFAIDGRKPAQCFDAIIALQSGWTVDYSEATDEEYLEWYPKDVICRCVRARLQGRPIYYQDRVIQGEDIVSAMVDFVQEHDGQVPDVIEDNETCLTLAPPQDGDEEETEPLGHR